MQVGPGQLSHFFARGYLRCNVEVMQLILAWSKGRWQPLRIIARNVQFQGNTSVCREAATNSILEKLVS